MSETTPPTGAPAATVFAPNALNGRVAVLTGGGGGLGTATALAFSRAGARLVISSRRLETAETAARYVRSEGGDAIALALDVLDEEQVEAALDQAVEYYGAIDVLSNFAGNTVVVKSLDCRVEDFDRILRLNITGQFLAARAAARRMIARGLGGSIILMSSILAYGGTPRRAAYTASRAGVNNLTRTLAVEWALDGIRVNCVAPGWTLTQAFMDLVAAGKFNMEPLVERTPMGRLPEAEDVANVILFLASDASRMVTGVTIPIDGGVTAYLGPGGKPSLA